MTPPAGRRTIRAMLARALTLGGWVSIGAAFLSFVVVTLQERGAEGFKLLLFDLFERDYHRHYLRMHSQALVLLVFGVALLMIAGRMG